MIHDDMPKLILGLVGQAGCGKGTAADLLVKEFGAGYFRFSAILGDVLARIHVEKTRDNLIKISNALRREFGEDVLSYAIEQDAVSAPQDVVVIDGIRRPEDIVSLEASPLFELVAIEVPARLRYERMKKRGEKVGEGNMTWEQFQTEEQAPTEVTIPQVMERADYHIPNEGSREEFEQRIRALMTELGV
jgi:dephospho-CoA kinase